MKWFKFVIVMTVFCFVCAEESADEEAPESVRDMRELDREGWRAVETLPEDRSGWIPHEQQPQQLEQFPKRRRLRKRKRRPPVNDSLYEEDTVADRVPPVRRKSRPQGLEQFHQPWEELSGESLRKPNVRRRVTPSYQSSEEVVISDEIANVNPLAVTVRVEDDQQKQNHAEPNQIFYGNTKDKDIQPPNVPDLKTVLKQRGNGLSLSEILQQKNLSLSELLMGDQKAISALTEKPNDVIDLTDTKPTDSERDINKYKRLPPSVVLRKNINRNFEQELESIESLTSRETLEAQRKRLALLSHRDNNLFSSVTKLDVITEPTTEKRIFVPSHPKYYTSLNFKPNFNFNNEPSTEYLSEIDETTTVIATTSIVAQLTNRTRLPQKQSLPITNAKINKLKITNKEKESQREDENYPLEFKFPEPIKIDITEVFGFKDRGNRTTEETKKKDEPLRMSIDLEGLIEKTTKKNDSESYIYQKTTPTQTEELITTKAPPPEKLHSVTAKDEIMEILRDPISRERLSRILEVRNMTLQELVEQRERGSSQLHLADIFHNETREPEPNDEPFVGHVNSDYFNSFPIFGRQQKSQALDEQLNKYTTIPSTPSTENTSEIREINVSPKEYYEVTSFPTIKIEANQNGNGNNHPFRWKELYPDLFSSSHEGNYKETEESADSFQHLNYLDDIHRLEDVENTLSLSSKEKLNFVEENNVEDEVLINIPTGVKSAIFVSLAIIGLSIIVFLTILLVFRWTQKQKTRLNYCSSLSSKIRAPIILQKRPAHAIRSFMNETLGRKKNSYYRTNVQSMADDMWDDCRDRKQSF